MKKALPKQVVLSYQLLIQQNQLLYQPIQPMPKEHCHLYGNRISVHEHSRRYEQQSVDPIRQTI